MPTEEKSCKNCGFNSSSDNYIAMCHDPKPCVDKSDWRPKGSIDIEIEMNMARKNEIELELKRVTDYLGTIDGVLNDKENPKTPNPIEKTCVTCGYNTSPDDTIIKCVDDANICAGYNRWIPILTKEINSDLFAEDVPDSKNQEEFKYTGPIKDSGERTDFGTGAVRDMHAGKGRCDLLPPAALLRLARHFENGAKKYGDRNWELGIPCHSFADSGMRHLLKYMNGDTDEDHLIAAIWNLMCLAETEEKRPEMMDIPSRMNKKKVDPKDTANYTAMNILQNLNDVTFSWDLSSAKDKAVNILKQVDRPTVTVELSADELALINRYKSGEFEEALRRINETREEINRKKEKYNESR